MVDDSQLEQILHDIKHVETIRVINTEKNRHTRYLLGITVDKQERLIRSLEKRHYIAGPEDDYDSKRQGKIWKFKRRYEDHMIYIKIKELEIIEDEEVIKCLSCHIDHM